MFRQLYPHVHSRIPTSCYYTFFNEGHCVSDTRLLIDLIDLNHGNSNFTVEQYLNSSDGYAVGIDSSTRECAKMLDWLHRSLRSYSTLRQKYFTIDHYFTPSPAQDCLLKWTGEEDCLKISIGLTGYSCIVELKTLDVTRHDIDKSLYCAFDDTINITLSLHRGYRTKVTISYVQLDVAR